jgi:hypothetical protein
MLRARLFLFSYTPRHASPYPIDRIPSSGRKSATTTLSNAEVPSAAARRRSSSVLVKRTASIRPTAVGARREMPRSSDRPGSMDQSDEKQASPTRASASFPRQAARAKALRLVRISGIISA